MTGSADERVERELSLIHESADDRRKRIEQLKGIIERGCYHVPGAQVADAVVAFYRRPEGWTGVRNTAAPDDSC